MILKLTHDQKTAVEQGRRVRRRLIRTTAKAAEVAIKDVKTVHQDNDLLVLEANNRRHYYIYGPSGIGKTHNMEKAVESTGVKHYVISGNISLWAFGVQLAVIKKYLKKDEKVVIIVDDVDELIKDSKSINQLKELLAKGVFSYNKKPQMHMLTSQVQIEAVEACMSDDGLGFTVDCSNFTFVITSNYQLPYDSTPDLMLEKNNGVMTPRIAYMKHLTAIRGRCNVKDLTFTKEEKWGNIAIVLLEDNGCPGLDEQQKIFLLNFMWQNWERMTETSIRTAEKMADIMLEEGEDYAQDAWETDFII